MANDLLVVGSGVQMGARVRNLIDNLKLADRMFQELTDHFNHLAADPDYAGVATSVSLKDVDGAATGSTGGETLYNLIVGAKAEFDADTNLQQLIARVDHRNTL